MKKIRCVVRRGRAVGTVLTPHRYQDGHYVVSHTRFKADQIEVFEEATLPDWVSKGYSVRMSGEASPSPSLIAPASIEIYDNGHALPARQRSAPPSPARPAVLTSGSIVSPSARAAASCHTFERFAPVIRELTEADLSDADALRAKFRLAEARGLEVCYAPFEYVTPKARIVLVGITPGLTQMVNALREARTQLIQGADSIQTLRAAKQTGAFSGAMRPNLVALLDCVAVNRLLNLSSCDALFGASAHLVQTTSVLRNPVFLRGQNYNGAPSILDTDILLQQVMDGFAQEAQTLRGAFFVPLGGTVTTVLQYLAARGVIDRNRVLDGLPHPSCANAERIAYFLGHKRREALSTKTNPDSLDQAREKLRRQVAVAN